MFELQLHHVALSVTDMAKAAWFYEEVLGLKPIDRPPFNFPGAWYELGTGRCISSSIPRPTRYAAPVTSIRATATWRFA